MKKNRNMLKRGGKVTLALALAFSMILGMTPTSADAQTYGEWQEQSKTLLNGSFEVGYEDMDVYGWHLTSMTSAVQIETDTEKNWAANYTLKSVTEDENKVAALSKVGGGYAAMTSSVITVEGGRGYRVAYDYKTTAVQLIQSGSDTPAFHGVRAVVQQFDADGNQIAWTILNNTGTPKGTEVMAEWQRATYDFVTEAAAKTVVLYVHIGGTWAVKATVLFDNVTVASYEAQDVINGDFEGVYYGQDGGRAGNQEGPACWTMATCDNGGAPRDEDFRGYYIAEIVEEDGNHVLKQYPKSSTAGYSLIQSDYIPVTAGTAFSLTWKTKITVEADGTLPTAYKGAYAVMYYYGSGKDYISYSNSISQTGELAACDWKSVSYADSVPEGASYVKIGFFIGGGWNQQSRFAYYYDDVSLFLDDGSNGAQVFNGDGELSDSGVPGWKMVTTGNGTNVDESSDWARNYTISCATEAGVGGSNAILVTKASSYGYAALASSKLKLDKDQEYTLQYAYKMTDFQTGTIGKVYPVSSFVITYDKDGNEVEKLTLDNQYEKEAVEVTEWTDSAVYSFTPTKDSAYAVLYLGMGSKDAACAYKVYFDNIRIIPQTSSSWRKETTNYEGEPRTDADFTANYKISTVEEGDRDDVLKLYVSREQGILGAVTFFSEAVSVKEKITYVTTYEFKMTGKDSTDANGTGAIYVIRFLDENGTILGYQKLNTPSDCPKANQDWTSYSKEFTVPKGAAAVQMGLLIGGTDKNQSKNLAYYYDNLSIQEKDPSVSASELYGKNILILGDEAAAGLEVAAENQSIMNVLNVAVEGAGFAETLTERVISQIDAAGNEGVDYILLSAGTADADAQVAVGTVTADDYSGNYDSTTFAGALEEAFMNLALTFDEKKIVYVFPHQETGKTDLSAYYTVAKAAAEKWEIPFIDTLYQTTADKTAYWSMLIMPLETVEAFDSTNISGLASKEVYEARLSKLAGEGITPATDVTALEGLLAKVEKDGTLPELAARIKGYLEEYDSYRAMIQGATIAENDTNKLRFFAQSPKKTLPAHVRLTRLGLLIMTEDKLQAGEALELENTSAKAVDTVYSAESAVYSATLSGDGCDPAVTYVAAAYAVYQVDGREYVLYSDNAYTNTYGTLTADAGVARASVYGIAKDIAAQIIATGNSQINWSYIGGSANQSQIEEAQEEGTAVTCYDVLRFVSYNHTLLQK